MDRTREKLLLVLPEGDTRERLSGLLRQAGYEVTAFAGDEGASPVLPGTDVMLLDAALETDDAGRIASEIKGAAATEAIRIILVCGGSPAERVRSLDLGADDVVSCPWDDDELLARVRVQLRAKKAEDELRHKARLAEEGQQIAHTAFKALAVTEKMTRDAFSLSRRLRIGLTAFIIVATVMAGTYFLFFRTSRSERNRAYEVIAQLQRGIASQEDLLGQARRMRDEMRASGGSKEELEQRSRELQSQMSEAKAEEVADLRRQLRENSSRLQRIEGESRVAQSIIQNYANSVCLLHVVVVFEEVRSRRRLRYGGVNAQGQPLQDSQGNPVFSLDGRGPEVRADFFGTGFLASNDGRILTNRHVVEPWWKNPEMEAMEEQGLQAVIYEISAYFPEATTRTKAEIQKIAQGADLAVLQGELNGLRRRALVLDSRPEAVASGQPVVSLGYATGLAAILARGEEENLEEIVGASGGDARAIVRELQRRKMIRPLATQGHVGDVLADKIVFDAQTTSGGSGGPLFNRDGKVVGVTFAVVRGFGGSNFGIPIRYAAPLLQGN